MHTYLVNASIQLLPVHTEKHPYVWVDEVIELIKASKLQCEVGAFATVVEGRYEDVMKLIHSINEYLLTQHCNEWILTTQLQMRCDADITALEKTEKHR